VIMFGLLLASVGVAGWLSRTRGAPARRGAEMIKRIRRDKLGRYWDKAEIRWLLLRRGGERPVGWRAVAVSPGDDDEFEGIDVRVNYSGRSPARRWECWALKGDATRGAYAAGTFAIVSIRGKASLGRHTDTRVVLGPDGIEVQQQLSARRGSNVTGPKNYQSTSRTPSNYLPEGTVCLAAMLVALDRTEAVFKQVFNELPPHGGHSGHVGTTRLGTVRMSHAAAPEGYGIDDEAFRVVTIQRSIEGQQVASEIHVLDEKAFPVLIAGESIVESTASEEEVAAAFPKAALLLRGLMKDLEFDFPAPGRTVNPLSRTRAIGPALGRGRWPAWSGLDRRY